VSMVANIQERDDQAPSNRIETLIKEADCNGPYAKGHSERVAGYAVALAEELGLSGERKREIEIAAKLHDIGKAIIDPAILKKRTCLTEPEWEILKAHPLISTHILETDNFPKRILSLVLNHHERVDGKGYPNCRLGNEIPIGARIISLADAYDAMTAGNTYKKTKSAEEAEQELIDNSGTQFDSKLVKIFLKALRHFYRQPTDIQRLVAVG